MRTGNAGVMLRRQRRTVKYMCWLQGLGSKKMPGSDHGCHYDREMAGNVMGLGVMFCELLRRQNVLSKWMRG